VREVPEGPFGRDPSAGREAGLKKGMERRPETETRTDDDDDDDDGVDGGGSDDDCKRAMIVLN